MFAAMAQFEREIMLERQVAALTLTTHEAVIRECRSRRPWSR